MINKSQTQNGAIFNAIIKKIIGKGLGPDPSK